jgi:hypothetical protein
MSAFHSLSRIFALAVSGAVFLTFGCADPLKTESLIQETRVLGARVEAAGDAMRASPGPGERAHLDVFVAAPDGPPSVAYAISLCAVAPSNTGFPSCVGAPFATALQTQLGLGDPQLDFEVPADLDVSTTPHGFASGIVCPSSPAELTSDGGARCASGASDAFAFEFDFAGPGEDNDNPTFTANSLTLDGATWTASAVDASCPGTLSEVHAASKHSVGVQLQDTDFDSLVQMSPEDPSRETLLVSQFSDAGALLHTFDSLTPDTPALQSDVEWDAPAKTDSAGTIVHFYFVVRDSRGGEDFATRALCLVP